jgi:hypothetical protein
MEREKMVRHQIAEEDATRVLAAPKQIETVRADRKAYSVRVEGVSAG